MNRRFALAVGVTLVAAAWASGGVAPFRDAVLGAPAPVDFVRDYVAAAARVHQGRGAAPIDAAGNTYAATLGAPSVTLLEGPYHLHPPPALLPILPLVPLGFGGAAFAWLALSLAALGVVAFVLVETVERNGPPSPARVALVFVLVLLWPPVLHNVAKGQWSILLAALVAAGWRALARGRPRAAGVWLGLAASFKATPVLLLGFLALRHRRAAGAMAATLVVTVVASLAVNGLPPWRAWLADAPRDVAAWQTWTANTASLNGLLSRLLAGGHFARPLVAAPAAARLLELALSVALVLGLGAATRGAPSTPSNERRLFAAWTILVVVLNPLAWTHTIVIALVPMAALVGDVPAWALALPLAILTVPREVLALLAGPVPVAPARGLLLSLHAGALLLVGGAALARLRRTEDQPDEGTRRA